MARMEHLHRLLFGECLVRLLYLEEIGAHRQVSSLLLPILSQLFLRYEGGEKAGLFIHPPFHQRGMKKKHEGRSHRLARGFFSHCTPLAKTGFDLCFFISSKRVQESVVSEKTSSAERKNSRQ